MTRLGTGQVNRSPDASVHGAEVQYTGGSLTNRSNLSPIPFDVVWNDPHSLWSAANKWFVVDRAGFWLCALNVFVRNTATGGDPNAQRIFNVNAAFDGPNVANDPQVIIHSPDYTGTALVSPLLGFDHVWAIGPLVVGDTIAATVEYDSYGAAPGNGSLTGANFAVTWLRAT